MLPNFQRSHYREQHALRYQIWTVIPQVNPGCVMPTKTCNFDHAALMPTSLILIGVSRFSSIKIIVYKPPVSFNSPVASLGNLPRLTLFYLLCLAIVKSRVSGIGVNGNGNGNF
jgi:hypothetical protein